MFVVCSFEIVPGFAFETGSHFEWNAELFCELDRARLHDLGTGPRHLEQFVVSDLIDFLCFGDDARIAREHAIDVGKNLAGVRFERAGECDRGQIGAAASKRCRFAFRRLSLKSGDDYDVIIREQFLNLSRSDVCDFRLGVNAIRQDSSLRACDRDRASAQRIDRHRNECA